MTWRSSQVLTGRLWCFIPAKTMEPYCWWKTSWYVSHYVQGFIHPRWLGMGFLNHQQYDGLFWNWLETKEGQGLKCHLGEKRSFSASFRHMRQILFKIPPGSIKRFRLKGATNLLSSWSAYDLWLSYIPEVALEHAFSAQIFLFLFLATEKTERMAERYPKLPASFEINEENQCCWVFFLRIRMLPSKKRGIVFWNHCFWIPFFWQPGWL